MCKAWVLYQSGKGVKQDDAKAIKFYEKACNADELSGCNSLASLYQNSGEHAKAATIFERACEKGFGLSCYNLAQIYEAGSVVALDESKALDLYVKACERGYAVVCYYLGGMYEDGWASENDEASKNALKFYSLACDGKIYEACEALGRLYEDGDARGCLNLARRLESSDKKQAAALRQKAQKLHEKECEAGLAKKCMEFKKSTNKGEKHEF